MNRKLSSNTLLLSAARSWGICHVDSRFRFHGADGYRCLWQCTDLIIYERLHQRDKVVRTVGLNLDNSINCHVFQTLRRSNEVACDYKYFVKTLRPTQNGCHFADDNFQCISLNENVWIFIKNSHKFVPKGPINNITALVQIMVWRRAGHKPLSEPITDAYMRHSASMS